MYMTCCIFFITCTWRVTYTLLHVYEKLFIMFITITITYITCIMVVNNINSFLSEQIGRIMSCLVEVWSVLTA